MGAGLFEGLDTRRLFGAKIATRRITEGALVKEAQISWIYAYGLGLVYEEDMQLFPYIHYSVQTLVYAKIDGIEYGSIPLKVEVGNIELPASFVLSQNYPNPFNPSTMFSFCLPLRSFVTLKVFDVMGRDVATIVSEELNAATYFRRWNAVAMPKGAYFYRLQAGGYSETKRLILLH